MTNIFKWIVLNHWIPRLLTLRCNANYRHTWLTNASIPIPVNEINGKLSRICVTYMGNPLGKTMYGEEKRISETTTIQTAAHSFSRTPY
jgi:hypothetical protein